MKQASKQIVNAKQSPSLVNNIISKVNSNLNGQKSQKALNRQDQQIIKPSKHDPSSQHQQQYEHYQQKQKQASVQTKSLSQSQQKDNIQLQIMVDSQCISNSSEYDYEQVMLPSQPVKVVQPQQNNQNKSNQYSNQNLECEEEPCPFCPKLFDFFQAGIMVSRALYLKYSSSQNYYYTKEINDLVEGAHTPQIVHFHDQVIFEEKNEYLTNLFSTKEQKEKIIFLVEYYKYHREVPRLFILTLLKVMNKHYEKHRRLEYYHIKHLLKQEQLEAAQQQGQQNNNQNNQSDDKSSAEGSKVDNENDDSDTERRSTGKRERKNKKIKLTHSRLLDLLEVTNNNNQDKVQQQQAQTQMQLPLQSIQQKLQDVIKEQFSHRKRLDLKVNSISQISNGQSHNQSQSYRLQQVSGTNRNNNTIFDLNRQIQGDTVAVITNANKPNNKDNNMDDQSLLHLNINADDILKIQSSVQGGSHRQYQKKDAPEAKHPVKIITSSSQTQMQQLQTKNNNFNKVVLNQNLVNDFVSANEQQQPTNIKQISSSSQQQKQQQYQQQQYQQQVIRRRENFEAVLQPDNTFKKKSLIDDQKDVQKHLQQQQHQQQQQQQANINNNELEANSLNIVKMKQLLDYGMKRIGGGGVGSTESKNKAADGIIYNQVALQPTQPQQLQNLQQSWIKIILRHKQQQQIQHQKEDHAQPQPKANVNFIQEQNNNEDSNQNSIYKNNNILQNNTQIIKMMNQQQQQNGININVNLNTNIPCTCSHPYHHQCDHQQGQLQVMHPQTNNQMNIQTNNQINQKGGGVISYQDFQKLYIQSAQQKIQDAHKEKENQQIVVSTQKSNENKIQRNSLKKSQSESQQQYGNLKSLREPSFQTNNNNNVHMQTNSNFSTQRQINKVNRQNLKEQSGSSSSIINPQSNFLLKSFQNPQIKNRSHTNPHLRSAMHQQNASAPMTSKISSLNINNQIQNQKFIKCSSIQHMNTIQMQIQNPTNGITMSKSNNAKDQYMMLMNNQYHFSKTKFSKKALQNDKIHQSNAANYKTNLSQHQARRNNSLGVQNNSHSQIGVLNSSGTNNSNISFKKKLNQNQMKASVNQYNNKQITVDSPYGTLSQAQTAFQKLKKRSSSLNINQHRQPPATSHTTGHSQKRKVEYEAYRTQRQSHSHNPPSKRRMNTVQHNKLFFETYASSKENGTQNIQQNNLQLTHHNQNAPMSEASRTQIQKMLSSSSTHNILHYILQKDHQDGQSSLSHSHSHKKQSKNQNRPISNNNNQQNISQSKFSQRINMARENNGTNINNNHTNQQAQTHLIEQSLNTNNQGSSHNKLSHMSKLKVQERLSSFLQQDFSTQNTITNRHTGAQNASNSKFINSLVASNSNVHLNSNDKDKKNSMMKKQNQSQQQLHQSASSHNVNATNTITHQNSISKQNQLYSNTQLTALEHNIQQQTQFQQTKFKSDFNLNSNDNNNNNNNNNNRNSIIKNLLQKYQS